MKMFILIRIKPRGEYFVAQTCWPTKYCGQNLKIIAQIRSEAITKIHELISVFIEGFGRRYIESCDSKNSRLNCPQGYLELPIDVWCCKNTKTPCPLQGLLDTSNSEKYFKLCLVSEETKNGIWNAIIRGKYKGFHHVPSRYRCGLCDRPRIYYNYHYPWELTLLSDHCDIKSIWSDIKRAKELVFRGFSSVAVHTALCCGCFQKASRFLPEINLSEYEIIIYDYRRSK